MSIVHSGAVLPHGDPVATLDSGVFGLLRRGRPTRVLLLATMIAVMSGVDLYITSLYLATIGMAEENPLARLVMSSGSLGYLSVWKLLTVLPTLLLMVAYRRRLMVEALGWVACVVLVNVMLRWVQYADETPMLMIALQSLQEGSDHRWVSLPG